MRSKLVAVLIVSVGLALLASIIPIGVMITPVAQGSDVYLGVAEDWVARYNGSANGFDSAIALALDGDGNIYVTGESQSDYVTIKYNTAGVEQWVARYNGPGNGEDGALALALDGDGNVYVTGFSTGTTSPVPYYGGFDYATVKYDNFGNQLWVARYNGPGNGPDWASAIAVDEAGNVYVTGESRNDGVSEWWDVGRRDYATIKYSSAGIEQWVARYNGPGDGYDWATAIAVDGAGNVYITGESKGNVSQEDYCTIKYNSAGVEQWVARYDGTVHTDDYASALKIDSIGNVYVTGWSYVVGGGMSYVTIKYNNLGNQLWVASYNHTGNGYNGATSLAVDGAGNVYVTGGSQRYAESIDPQSDYATVKYDSAGVEQWVARYDGSGSASDQAWALAVDAAGNVYVTGTSGGAETMDYATIAYAHDGSQLWVQRYDGGDSSIEMGDIARAIAVDGVGNVYVTGMSPGIDTATDYATIKYIQGPTTYTGVGSSVVAALPPVTVTFDTVTQAGNTTVVSSERGPAPPEGFELGTDPPTYFDIHTTAGYTPPVEVCIDYSDMNVKNENALKLMHWTGTDWEDVTTSLDTVSDIICGNVTSFSDFAMMVPIPNWVVESLLPATENNKAGRTMPVKFSLRVDASVNPAQPFVYDKDLTIKIFATSNPGNILQTSTFGKGARNYRIADGGRLYITNFQTLKTPMQYTVEVYSGPFMVGSFTFKTVK